VGNAAFLLVAIALSIVGSALLWLRYRRPKTFMTSIDDFQREMKALGHEPDEPDEPAESRNFVTRPSRVDDEEGQ